MAEIVDLTSSQEEVIAEYGEVAGKAGWKSAQSEQIQAAEDGGAELGDRAEFIATVCDGKMDATFLVKDIRVVAKTARASGNAFWACSGVINGRRRRLRLEDIGAVITQLEEGKPSSGSRVEYPSEVTCVVGPYIGYTDGRVAYQGGSQSIEIELGGQKARTWTTNRMFPEAFTSWVEGKPWTPPGSKAPLKTFLNPDGSWVKEVLRGAAPPQRWTLLPRE